MEKSEWLELENTKDLIKFLKEEFMSLSRDVISGATADPDNSDKTQYMAGKVSGLFSGYTVVRNFLMDKDEAVDDNSKEYT